MPGKIRPPSKKMSRSPLNQVANDETGIAAVDSQQQSRNFSEYLVHSYTIPPFCAPTAFSYAPTALFCAPTAPCCLFHMEKYLQLFHENRYIYDPQLNCMVSPLLKRKQIQNLDWNQFKPLEPRKSIATSQQRENERRGQDEQQDTLQRNHRTPDPMLQDYPIPYVPDRQTSPQFPTPPRIMTDEKVSSGKVIPKDYRKHQETSQAPIQQESGQRPSYRQKPLEQPVAKLNQQSLHYSQHNAFPETNLDQKRKPQIERSSPEFKSYPRAEMYRESKPFPEFKPSPLQASYYQGRMMINRSTQTDNPR